MCIPRIWRRAADHVDKIRAMKAAGLPVVQPTKFELVINLKTAKAIGLAVPAHAALRRRRSDRITLQIAAAQNVR